MLFSYLKPYLLLLARSRRDRSSSPRKSGKRRQGGSPPKKDKAPSIESEGKKKAVDHDVNHSDGDEKPRSRKNPKLAPERNISKLEDEANFEPDYELGDSDD